MCDVWFQGWTPLHYAVHHNRSKMVLLLIAHGASPDDNVSQAFEP